MIKLIPLRSKCRKGNSIKILKMRMPQETTEDVKNMEKDRVAVLLLTLSGRVFVVLYESSEAEVSHFTHQVITNQDVGSPEVPVHIVHSFHVRHSRGDLRTAHIL